MQIDFFSYPLVTQKKTINVSSIPHRSPFRYPGGKTWFVPFFRKWMRNKKQKPSILIEPFAGGGIIGLTAGFENLADKIILVEKDENVAIVWKVILEKDYNKLADEILSFNLNFDSVRKILESKPVSIYKKALQTIVCNRVSYGGIMAHGSGLTKKGENGKGLASRWYPDTLAKRIQRIGHIRDKFSFIHGCGFSVIEKYKGVNNSCFFIDPPYTVAGKRLYKYHKIDHQLLFDLFRNSTGDFIFTYDTNKEILEMAKKFNFQISLVPMKNTHNILMEELIIGKDLSWIQKK